MFRSALKDASDQGALRSTDGSVLVFASLPESQEISNLRVIPCEEGFFPGGKLCSDTLPLVLPFCL
jgi:hypothetical protein